MNAIEKIMRTAPVIPVLVVEDAGEAREIAEALVEGGLKVLEVTLRTEQALHVIRRMNLVKGAIVGAGTVTNKDQLDAAMAAGAEFIVSPGLTEPLTRAAQKVGVPFLPGVATAGDIMRGMDMGLEQFKFFPATAAGGLPALKALAAPFFGAKFCPTGGITAANAPEWLAHKQVLCVGGSWIVPPGAKPEAIRALAAEAAPLGGSGAA
ncbi:bifunctional 4-hydroxy-2-oxoglutarate aldolase/2-dehydro-3-deoxy-phosphogluconate aldolase [Altererythrobacter sp. KTW20L]|uniref:bifunctional 4-hydroxy-2-oxoglutarate aldolase/2-dehydro-3-deoxy-phosphogluconate aldolase n=1 Tax=Altererythrobacter sp. KTW20L TaxID=2942210 RepID=UPI0020C161AB|nr:bifunctional 4-hydroxy-2-oxoglutarate aldolase/2-dehydro-3-deoxy-phosphogluconate aldolase [Altererythrobacter sp. KTW20L]MCL6250897.1 bifunctional 4-hydroxy-2-oxoglutarate aldolase/2-dehydro-3-deoxy-phosphogluconate aldolase [Altererythrobacter sp. KTW20L]